MLAGGRLMLAWPVDGRCWPVDGRCWPVDGRCWPSGFEASDAGRSTVGRWWSMLACGFFRYLFLPNFSLFLAFSRSPFVAAPHVYSE
jgi:hypothetical protein